MQVTAELIEQARSGDARALEALARHAQTRVYPLAVRMLGDPDPAQDATQEILIRVVTKLSSFRGESRFDTWVYRVATNYLLTAKKVRARDPRLTFDVFGADLETGLVDDLQASAEDHVMLNELRIRCTMAMLLCLDRDHRVAYVLGEIMEMSQSEATAVLDVSPDTYRKRLSRARADVQAFTARSCGLAAKDAACRCSRRLPTAMAMGRVPAEPSAHFADAPTYGEVRVQAAQTEARLVAAKLQRATGPLMSTEDIARHVMRLVDPPG
ncbi:RNA polymerase sigma factor [uncultured Shimia sp.]|uniref:RNA polymerase sigma factor n=1 Tax=uncultured Shimia sp. TaxID=573152 RepID=UPI002637025C|nr:RNA polymerase sigma factor [uncultured Shimia sp.]